MEGGRTELLHLPSHHKLCTQGIGNHREDLLLLVVIAQMEQRKRSRFVPCAGVFVYPTT